MSEPVLDLADPEVRSMVRYNHKPREMWSLGGQLLTVSCETCNQPWPCPTRQELLATEPTGVAE